MILHFYHFQFLFQLRTTIIWMIRLCWFGRGAIPALLFILHYLLDALLYLSYLFRALFIFARRINIKLRIQIMHILLFLALHGRIHFAKWTHRHGIAKENCSTLSEFHVNLILYLRVIKTRKMMSQWPSIYCFLLMHILYIFVNCFIFLKNILIINIIHIRILH